MLLPGTISPRTWFILTILIAVIVLGETTNNHRLDLKFGFDLTQGSNGAPTLHIREFEGSSNINRRADDDSNESDTVPKAKLSSSDSDSDEPIKRESSNEKSKEKESDDSDTKSDENNESDGNERARSTKGLKAADFELEDVPKIHLKFNKHSSDEDSDGSRRRRSIVASNIEKVKTFGL